MQQPPLGDPVQQQAAAMAMMWQMQQQMAGAGAPPAVPPMGVPPMGVPPMGVPPMGVPPMGMPPWPPMGAGSAPMLTVRVDGLRFEYQLTEDDVRKVFARYGEVVHVEVDKEGTTAQVQLSQPHQTVAARQDLDKKQLAGMSGAFLRVDFAAQQPYVDPLTAQMMAAASPFGAPGMGHLGMPPPVPGYPGTQPGQPSVGPSPDGGGQPKKYTCKLEVGIENLDDFRVGSRAIQIARQIWQDPKFQEAGGKTRVRGKTVGGPHEADEPLALCISCRDQAAFDKAVRYAEQQLLKVHADYRTWCQDAGKPIPDLQVKISTKGSSLAGAALPSNADIPRGERPDSAPSEEEIEKLIEERNEARKSANFKRADEIRDTLKDQGVVLMDEKGAKGNFNGSEVTKWRYWRP